MQQTQGGGRQRRRRRTHEAKTMRGRLGAVFGSARDHRLVHRRHRGVPARVERGHRIEERMVIEARRAHDAAAACQRRQQRPHQAVDVEQRHHIQAAVLRQQTQVRGDVVGRRHQVGLAQRYQLGPGRGARGVQQQRHIVGRARRGVSGRRRRRVDKPEAARRGCKVDIDVDNPQAQLVRHLTDRPHLAAQHQHHLGAGVPQMKTKLRRLVRRVQRCAGGAGCHTQERHRHLGAVGQHQRHPRRGRRTQRAQLGTQPLHLRVQLGITQRISARGQKGRRVGLPARLLAQQRGKGRCLMQVALGSVLVSALGSALGSDVHASSSSSCGFAAGVLAGPRGPSSGCSQSLGRRAFPSSKAGVCKCRADVQNHRLAPQAPLEPVFAWLRVRGADRTARPGFSALANARPKQ